MGVISFYIDSREEWALMDYIHSKGWKGLSIGEIVRRMIRDTLKEEGFLRDEA